MSLSKLLCAIAIILIFCTCIARKKEVSQSQVQTGLTKNDQRILVFSKSVGWAHASIPAGITAIQKLGAAHGFQVDTTKNADYFTEDSLLRYQAVVFLSTTKEVLDYRQQAEFERYIQAGGGFVGIHAAADTEPHWPWYNKLIGAYFESHPHNPDLRKATIKVNERNHPATRSLPAKWERTDEWYSYKSINPDIKVLATLDESTYDGGTNGKNHPIIWYHPYDGGRSFYTGLGHTLETYTEPLFLQHLLGGIQYAMGENIELDYSKARNPKVPEENRFTKTILGENLDEPMELAVTNDGRIIFIERHGNVKLFSPAIQHTKTIAKINVYSRQEDGLLGVTLDPDFDTNKWIYFFYSPAGKTHKQHLSRFVLEGDSLIMASEKVLLEIPVIRDQSNHSGGSLAFGPGKNLFISLGDNTVPFASDGYAPIDERPKRQPWDAQKSSGSPNDLRGKILRIHPEKDGTYTIPEGNLFPKGTAGTRPEIYVMGNRNPFRISIDQKTGFLYWGEVGPDAGNDSTGRGPRGHDEVNQAKKAGNFGWPYFVGDNKPYNDYNFETKTSGPLFNPQAPVNDSPNNTGIQNLPPAQKAFIWYPYAESKEFPIVDKGGRNAMAGPVFYYDAFDASARRFPKYYDGKLLIYDWMRNWIMAVTMDKKGDLLTIEPFLPSFSFSKPMDMQFGKDGALYMLEYGTYWGSQNADARLVKLEYAEGNRPPVAKLSADKTVGKTPLTVSFSSAGTIDHDKGGQLRYAWYFTGENTIQSTEPNPVFTFEKPGIYKSKLVVTDAEGASTSAQVEIKAGNDAPLITFDIQGNKSFFWDNQKKNYQVKVTDAEDGTLEKGITADQVMVTFDYLPQGKDIVQVAQGHQITPARYMTGKNLIDNSDCKACHALDKKSVGPAYVEVAKRYQQDTKAVTFLATKIIKGGNGNWGEQAMSAHPQLSEPDAREMVQYILSLAPSGKQENRLPVKGAFTTNKHSGSAEEASYYITASYTDKGSQAVPSITTRAELVLRHPRIPAADFNDFKGVARKNDQGNKSRFVRFSEHKAYIVFKNIDLSQISHLTYKYSCNQVSGKLELHLDSPDGKLISSTEVKPAGKWVEQDALIEKSEGVHDLYFVYINDKGNKLISIWNTFNVDWIHFKKEGEKTVTGE